MPPFPSPDGPCSHPRLTSGQQEGAFTTLFALLVLLLGFLPRTPAHISPLFLSMSEKARVVRVLSEDQREGVSISTPAFLTRTRTRKDSEFEIEEGTVEAEGVEGETDGKGIQWAEVGRTMGDVRIWLLVIAGFFNGSFPLFRFSRCTLTCAPVGAMLSGLA